MLEEARCRYSPVHKARVAFTVPANELFSEGLAVDTEKQLFYMGSMHRRKIVRFALNGTVCDFVKQVFYDVMPLGGVHVDPVDQKHRPELLHFDSRRGSDFRRATG